MTPPATPQKRDALLEEISAARIEVATNTASAGLVPITIRCKWSACAHDHHTLDYTGHVDPGGRSFPKGHCQACGKPILASTETAGLVSDDFGNVIGALNSELIRHHYWSVSIDLRAWNKAKRVGRKRLHEQAMKRVTKEMTRNDSGAGHQTSYFGDVIAYAQHAVAACCRKCAAYWYGLPSDLNVPPSDAQIQFMVSAVQTYLDIRLPDLPNEAQKVAYVSREEDPSEVETALLDNLLLDRLVRGDDPSGLLRPVNSTLKFRGVLKSGEGFVSVGQMGLDLFPAA
jgi:hypothetical protein